MTRVAILWRGSIEDRSNFDFSRSRFQGLFEELRRVGIQPEPCVYDEAFSSEVRAQLENVDGVLVWVNPLQDGRTRSSLDALLRDISSKGIFVSAHPDVIPKLGSKEVLFQTREMEWGGDIHLYHTAEEMQRGLTARLDSGISRVVKQNRGNNGLGVWRIQRVSKGPESNPILRLLHAAQKSAEIELRMSDFIDRVKDWFSQYAPVIDQPFFSPMPYGMTRCYLVRDRVVGFGHQYVTALVWSETRMEAPRPAARLYYPESQPEFQQLRNIMEARWVREMLEILDLDRMSLPILWDIDLLQDTKTSNEELNYRLCEINVSSVHPFPDSALAPMARVVAEAIGKQ